MIQKILKNWDKLVGKLAQTRPDSGRIRFEQAIRKYTNSSNRLREIQKVSDSERFVEI